jgi:hypothetical protein
MYNRVLGLIFLVLAISGCVSNQAVQTIQVGDDEKSCQAIKSELARLGAKFEDAKDDSGVTGKNVGLAIVFWPGIIVNEVRANKNQDSIDARVSHLSTVYNSRCLGDDSSESKVKSLSEQLSELKNLHDQGLISEDEYEVARKRVLKEL